MTVKVTFTISLDPELRERMGIEDEVEAAQYYLTEICDSEVIADIVKENATFEIEDKEAK